MKRIRRLVGCLAVALVLTTLGTALASAKEKGIETPKITDLSASDITTHSATITVHINAEGSPTEYVIWFDPGCYQGGCERLGPDEAKTGTIAATAKTKVLSVRVTNATEGTDNNEYWVVATNAAGKSESKTRSFRAKGKHPEY